MLPMLSCTAVFLHTALMPVAAPRLIMPGRSIGHIRLGERESRAEKELGPSNMPGNAAMQSENSGWRTSDRNELDLNTEIIGYITDKTLPASVENDSLVREIRVTSPYFVTDSGISTANRLGQILRAYPAAKLSAHYTPEDTHKTLYVYDDVKQGIAFEVSAKSNLAARCVAIVVHRRGKWVTEEYAPVEPYENDSTSHG